MTQTVEDVCRQDADSPSCSNSRVDTLENMVAHQEGDGTSLSHVSSTKSLFSANGTCTETILEEHAQLLDNKMSDNDKEMFIEENPTEKSTYHSQQAYNYFPSLSDAKDQAVHLAECIWECAHIRSLPEWLQDNDFLHHGHRPQLPSFGACFMSVFRIHTETGNIWSHFLGFLLFFTITAYIYTRPHHEVHLEQKFVFMPFLLGAIACMAFSSAFHTVYCHSERINKLFLKLDYVGISLLIMGSFVPWLYYSFYCRVEPKLVYISLILFIGLTCIWVSFSDTFSDRRYKPLRAGIFASFGLCGVIPSLHYFITDGVRAAFTEAAFGWLLLMAFIYLLGAGLYAFRIPERFFPGKCDIWFQSHQLFHLLVVVAAFINYHGINVLSVARLNGKSCPSVDPISSLLKSEL